MANAKSTGANVTLIRGRKYTLIHPFDRRLGAYQFEKGVPRPVADAAVVEHIRSLTDTVIDGDGMEIEKPMFRVTALEPAAPANARRAAPVESDDDDDNDAPRRPAIRGRRKV